ncbi:MAG: peptidoglycan-binding protein [Candidatus Liptonbacteria bacterium]|nr:peptidoglycan-binding protein [Candidatus Liptonbacteria bacterium]
MRKTFLSFLLAGAVLVGGFGVSHAQAASDPQIRALLEQVNSLQSLVESLQAQVKRVSPPPPLEPPTLYAVTSTAPVSPPLFISPVAPSTDPVSVPIFPVKQPRACELPRAVAKGLKGNEIKVLQGFLAIDPTVYPEGFVTGYYGDLTDAALKRFQIKYKLPVTGKLDPETRAKLEERIEANKYLIPECNAPNAGVVGISPLPPTLTPPPTALEPVAPILRRLEPVIPTPQPLPIEITPLAPTITVLSPNGGEKYLTGSSITVRWSQNYSVSSLVIRMFGDNGLMYYSGPASGLNGNNERTLPPEASNVPDGQYRVRVCDEQTPRKICDDSDNTFTIAGSVRPVINVLSPNGGEQLQIGSNTTINWRTSSTLPTGNNVVYLALEKPGDSPFVPGAAGVLLGAGGLPTTGSYTWKAGDYVGTGGVATALPGSQYRIVAALYSFTTNQVLARDTSDLPFSLIAPAPLPTITPQPQPEPVFTPTTGGTLDTGNTRALIPTISAIYQSQLNAIRTQLEAILEQLQGLR